MRSATSNRFLNVWVYDPTNQDYWYYDPSGSGGPCSPSNKVWTLAEVAAAQTDGGTADYPLGTYFWPIHPWHRPIGPTQKIGDFGCNPGYRASPGNVDIYCNSSATVCISADQIAGCPSSAWNIKLGVQWEYSVNDGVTWFRLPATSLTLDSTKISIGLASTLTANMTAEQELLTVTSEVRYATQFYGVIDSIRISRGLARYTGRICQPYDPAASHDELIDDYVVFALNVGKNPWQFPGGITFPYYVKNRGWLVNTETIPEPTKYTTGPEIRNFYPDAISTAENNNPDVYINTGSNLVSPPVFSLTERPAPLALTAAVTRPTMAIAAADSYYNDVYLLLHMEEYGGSTSFLRDSSNSGTPDNNGDNFYPDVACLLHGEETDGVTSIVDSGPRPKTFTTAGDVTISTEVLNFGRPSILIGPNSSLTTEISSDFAFGTGDFTVEFWMNPVRLSNADSRLISFGGGAYQYINLASGLNGSPFSIVNEWITHIFFANPTVTLNQWHHVAYTRSGNTVYLFFNGAQVGSGYVGNISTPNCALQLLAGNGSIHFADIRITKGVARYPGGSFSRPTTQFPVVLANRRRTSIYGQVTRSNELKKWGEYSLKFPGYLGSDWYSYYYQRIACELPSGFLPSQDWVIEGWFFPTEGYGGLISASRFNSNNSQYEGIALTMYDSYLYLQIDNTQVYNPSNGSTRTTLNTWHHIALVKSGNKIALYRNGAKLSETAITSFVHVSPLGIGNRQYSGSEWNEPFRGYIDDIRFTAGTDRDYSDLIIDVPAAAFPDVYAPPVTPAVPVNFVSQPDDQQLFLLWKKPAFNGGANITDYVIEYTVVGDEPVTVNVGSKATSYRLTGLTNGLPVSIRIAAINSVGTGAYTTAVTSTPSDDPPDAFFDNVLLLLHMDGEDDAIVFTDLSIYSHRVTRNGSTKIVTAQSKWPSAASARFTGSGDYLSLPTKNVFSFGTGDFTVEFFVRFPSVPGGVVGFIDNAGSTNSANNQYWYLLYTPGTLVFGRHSVDQSATVAWTPNANVWYHIAVVRSNGEIKIFIDGEAKTVAKSLILSGVSFSNNGLSIGLVATPHWCNAFIDDLRLTSAARYLDSFPQRTRAFPDRGLVVALPSAPTRLHLVPRDRQLLLSWKRPDDAGGVAVTNYIVEYKVFGGAPVTVLTNSSDTTYALNDLINGTQYTVRVAAINSVGQGPYSASVRRTPENNLVNFFEVHNYLTYSNRSAGYLNRCGIQFPMVFASATDRDIAQALVLEDAILPPIRGRDIFVDYATTENLTADFAGDLWGKKKLIDNNEAKPGKRVLVKNQDEQPQNGIYVVQEDLIVGQGSSTPRPWKRITKAGTAFIDDYTDSRVIVKHGKKNIGTTWNSQTSYPILGESPVVFEQDQMMGVYNEDFCVESYFKVSRFLHPPTNTRGSGMTLIDTYYRDTEKDGGDDNGYSGVRIYFSPDDATGKTGRVFVDVGTHDSNPAPVNEWVVTTPSATAGPALKSKTIFANVFYHVAVTRADDTFRLYINGEMQEQFTTQDKSYTPLNLTTETNYYKYRARAYFDTDDYAATQWIRMRLLRSEFFFQRNTVELYATRFNGAAGMISSTDNRLINLPTTPNGYASWPGKPIPDWPASAHVYIMNDLSFDTLRPLNFSVRPSLRFPGDTLVVDLATTSTDTKYVANDNNEYYVPESGNIQLYGLYGGGTSAEGNAVFVMSSVSGFLIPQNTVLTYSGVTFTPKDTYSVVNVPPSTLLSPGQLRIQSDGAGNYVVTVPVMAQRHGTDGNVALNTEFTTGSTFANLVRIYAPSAFAGGSDDNVTTRTIDGAPVYAGMRILVKDQLVAAQNGIYVASEEEWQRASDMNQSSELRRFTRVFVEGGYTNSNLGYLLNISNTIAERDIAINITPITFGVDENTSGAGTKFIASGQQGNCVGTGLEVADESAAAVTCVTTASINLYGIPARASTDNYQVSVNDIVLVKAQTDARENGIYIVTAQSWRRAPYLSRSSQFINNLLIAPVNGDSIPLDANNKKVSVACRMYLPQNFTVDGSPITFGPFETLDKLYLPFYWRPAFVGIIPDGESGLTQITSGTPVAWNDYVPDRQSSAAGANNDKTAWRIRMQCGKTVFYSRSIILRAASALGIQYVQETGAR